jgi:PDZ domain/Aspartyl protease
LTLKYILVLLSLMLCQLGLAQDNFYIKNNANKYVMPFKMVNNLMIIPVYVNGKKLSFLLDTGVSNTVILNVRIKDSLKLRNTKKIRIQGLGVDNYVDALKSTSNYVQVGNSILNRNHKIYLILGKGFNLSNRMGEQINGIIGGDLFKDFIVKINYSSKRITFYNPDRYKYKSCRKCQTLPLSFLFDKPYIVTTTKFNDSTQVNTNLLIDSGGSDALWLFESKQKNINIPKKYFIDYLGQGLNGNIYGKRSRISSFNIGRFQFKNMTVSFPDTLSLSSTMRHKSRHGSIGAATLKRFHLIIDYPHSKITFKKNTRFFYEAFNYNMSGIEVAYNGQMIVKEQRVKNLAEASNNFVSKTAKGETFEFEYDYVLSLKPSVQITDVREDSPAYKAGVKVGDFILELNGKPVYTYSLQQLMHKFYEKEGNKIELLLDRDGTRFFIQFRLKKIL